MTYIPNAKIEKKAADVLRDANSLVAPVPLDIVAHRLGLKLEAAQLGDDVSGVLVVENGRGSIGYNAEHAPVRQRFTIAHEIGHYVLHQQTGNLFIDKAYTVYRRDERSAKGEHAQEIQANQFGAALLMPKELVEAEVERLDFDLGEEHALESLAEKFGVSQQAMAFRLSNIGTFALGSR